MRRYIDTATLPFIRFNHWSSIVLPLVPTVSSNLELLQDPLFKTLACITVSTFVPLIRAQILGAREKRFGNFLSLSRNVRWKGQGRWSAKRKGIAYLVDLCDTKPLGGVTEIACRHLKEGNPWLHKY